MAALDSLSRLRAVIVAVLTAVAYLAASYLAQGAFKELFEAAFLLGFALWLRDLSGDRDRAGGGLLALLPGAVIAAGALYVYSWPGLAWLGGDARALGAGRALPAPRRGRVDASAACCRAPSSGPCCSSSSRPPRSTGSASSGPASTPSPSGHRDRTLPAVATAGRAGSGRRGRTEPRRPCPGSGPITTTRSATSSARSTPARSSGSGRAATSGSTRATERCPRSSSTSAPRSARWRWRSARSPGVAAGRRPRSSPRSRGRRDLAGRPGRQHPVHDRQGAADARPVVMLIAARGLLDPVAPMPLRTGPQPSRRRRARRLRSPPAPALSSAPRPRQRAGRSRRLHARASASSANRFAGQPTLLLAPAAVVADQHGSRVLRLGAAWRRPGRGRRLRAGLRRRPAGRRDPGPRRRRRAGAAVRGVEADRQLQPRRPLAGPRRRSIAWPRWPERP